MMVLPITRQTVTHQATEALRERILRGVYGDDTPLRQDALAAELGVSRIPIREALRQLEAEGLVVFNPHRGAVVSSLSVDEIDELFELRAQIESDLVRRAVVRSNAEDVARAKEILKAYEAAFRGAEVTKWGKLNWEFHSTLYAPADRPFTMAIIQRLHQQSDRYLRMQLVLTHGESRAIGEHRAILAAVAAHDVKQACSLMRHHILGAGRQLVRFVSAERQASGERTTKERRS
ncbi:MAG TPA: GntR family transcriptional regulator [Gemmatimonadaceae bacterium]